MNDALRALSIWRGPNEPALTYRGAGRVRVKQNDGVIVVKIRICPYKNADLPMDPMDWAMVATNESGEHYPKRGAGEIANVKQYAGFKRLITPR